MVAFVEVFSTHELHDYLSWLWESWVRCIGPFQRLGTSVHNTVEEVSIGSIRQQERLDTPLCWLMGHVLDGAKPTTEANCGFINRKICEGWYSSWNRGIRTSSTGLIFSISLGVTPGEPTCSNQNISWNWSRGRTSRKKRIWHTQDVFQ